MTDDELDQVETDQLVAAIRRRSTASIIALSNDLDAARESKIVWYQGGMSALGLVHYARAYVEREFLQPSTMHGE